MQISKPPHKRFLLSSLSEETYSKYAQGYACCKQWGVRSIYCYLTGTGLFGVAKKIAKGQVVQYGKRRLAIVVIASASYVCSPAIAVITNATKVVKGCKVVYTTIGYIAEATEDASQVTFLPLDIVLFGQPIPANKEGRFSNWANVTHVLKDLPGLD